MTEPRAWYREYAPCSALQSRVYTFFSFVPGSVPAAPGRHLVRQIAFQDMSSCSPQLADGHVSIVFELGRTFGERWRDDSSGLRGTIIGPMIGVGRTGGGEFPEMIGVLFRPACASRFLRVSAQDLVDGAFPIDSFWAGAGNLAGDLRELGEAGRLDYLESALVARLAIGKSRFRSVDVEGLAASVIRSGGRAMVPALAHAAGVSRQHLTREFRDRIGIGPKLYSRLARFQSGLKYAGHRASVDWAAAALDMGYADQSHLIAEFRQFSGLTPQELSSRDWFHPFIERAKRAVIAKWR